MTPASKQSVGGAGNLSQAGFNLRLSGIAKQLTSSPQGVHPAKRFYFIGDEVSYKVKSALHASMSDTFLILRYLASAH